jgi:hypothetical protein
LGVPVAYVAAAIASKGFTTTPTSLVVVGAFLFMFAVTGGLALSVVTINAYLSFKAKLRWAFPDAQAWSAASTSKTSRPHTARLQTTPRLRWSTDFSRPKENPKWLKRTKQ